MTLQLIFLIDKIYIFNIFNKATFQQFILYLV